MHFAVTMTYVVVIAVSAGVVLVASATIWWQPVLLAPSLGVAVWSAWRWDRNLPGWLIGIFLGVAAITWLVASILVVNPAASLGLAVVGGSVISRLPAQRYLASVGLLAGIAIIGTLAARTDPDYLMSYALLAPLVAAVIVAVFWLNEIAWRLFTELESSRHAETELALMAERFRFATELHDIQGHTLHVVKLKTHLAHKLIDRDPASARAELQQVENLIDETIADTRGLIYGQHVLNFAAELANATSLFEAAGIAVHLDADDEPEPSYLEVFSLLLRETTTNVLRHAQATRVTIRVAPKSIRITNDGVPSQAGELRLRGLAMLSRRIHELGGEFSACSADDSFTTAANFEQEASK